MSFLVNTTVTFSGVDGNEGGEKNWFPRTTVDDGEKK
jgi:hypothetical protein